MKNIREIYVFLSFTRISFFDKRKPKYNGNLDLEKLLLNIWTTFKICFIRWF